MSIFTEITIRSCEKILAKYELQADEQTYKGKEAGLLIQRNETARCLIILIKNLKVKDGDYSEYFKQILLHIDSTLNEVKKIVQEYNSEKKTDFTTDLYESFFTPTLKSFITSLSDLYQKSPAFITQIEDESLFRNSRKTPWIYQFSYILYEYILEREFEIAMDKTGRDVFDEKKQLIFHYLKNAVSLDEKFKSEKNNEDDPQYKEHVKSLLLSMQREEQTVQQRKTETTSTTNSMFGYFNQSLYPALYKASEKIMGKSQLGQKIDLLLSEYNERNKHDTGLKYF